MQKLDELDKSGVDILTLNESEIIDETEQRENLMLRGLQKLRKIGRIEDTKQRIKGMRMIRTNSDKEIFRSFVHYVLKYMVPINTWNGSKESVKLSYIFTIHDEAFAILTMMNNWNVWEMMAKGEKRGRGSESNTLFTNVKMITNTGIEIKMKGWSNEGLKEFNQILRYLITVRNKDEIKMVEMGLLEEQKELTKNKIKKRKRENEDEVLIAEREVPLDGYNLLFMQE